MSSSTDILTEAEPAWEIAHLFPLQGDWSEEAYLILTKHTNRLVELSDGNIEVVPMPTRTHQRLIAFLYRLMFDRIETLGLGNVFLAGLRVRLWDSKIREPDIVVMLTENREREGEAYFDRADLVVEVVSDDDPARDLVKKRAEYAQAGIAEYWIIEPKTERVTVLRLEAATYVEHGMFARGEQATSALLPSVSVDVNQLFDAAAR